jgi:HD-GYP domain-containing protein (c-di-GMP phosphodiesterase class II)
MAWERIPDWADAVSKSLLQALKERDPYTYGHCRRVARNAKLLAQAAGLNDHEQKIIEYSSMFHDIGKIAIPDHILFKPGKLTGHEEAVIREHPVKSAEIIEPLTQFTFFRSMIPGIRHHHERIDGAGYPDGIQGDAIPLHARIILIVDSFDAITTTRPYRSGSAVEFAYREIKQFAGRQFDAELAKIFLKAHPTWQDIEEEITEEFIVKNFRRAA